MAVEVALAMLQQEGRWFMQLRDEIPTIVAPGPVAGGSLAGSSIPERRPNRFYSANCWRKSSAAPVSSASSPPIPRGSGHRARACTTPRDAAPRQARRPRFASRVAGRSPRIAASRGAASDRPQSLPGPRSGGQRERVGEVRWLLKCHGGLLIPATGAAANADVLSTGDKKLVLISNKSLQ